MRVALTGGSGFIGSHTVVRLLAHGHQPRLLVRDEGKAARVLAARGVLPDDVELVVGDMTDVRAVATLLDGVDALIHAAAAIGVTPGDGALGATNVLGVERVVGEAVRRGLDPVIHVSTVAVFVPPDRDVITADGRLAAPRTDYGRSKLAAERFVRRLQDEGAPVTIVYPGGVLGAGQPSHDAFMEGLAGALGSVWPMPRGGVALIHVEDLAEALARMVVPGLGARRLMLGGDFLRWPELADLCDELTGVRCRRVVLPAWVILAIGSALDLARRVWPFDYPLTRDGAEIMVSMVPTDDEATTTALGLQRRPARETVEDALRALAADGHLSPARAGRLAPPGAAAVAQPGWVERGKAWVRRHVVPPLTGSAAFARLGPRIVPRLDRFTSRVSGGRFVFSEITSPALVLTTTGARSGEPREVTLACVAEPRGAWLVVGSNFGRAHHPAWSTNLLQTPAAKVRFRGRERQVVATLVEGAEREQAWRDLMHLLPVFDAYTERSGRDLRVFRLSPVD